MLLNVEIEKPKISIIVPIYNVEAYIARCLDSLFDQDLDESLYEVITVNDGTPDNSMLIVKQYAKFHRNIRVINQKNEGVSSARNNGINFSRGEYLLFVDPDDWIAKNSLNSIYEYLLKNEDFEVLFCKSVLNSTNKERYIWRNKVVENKFYTGEDLCILNYIRGSVCGGVYKRKFLMNKEISFPKDVSNGEDSIFIIQLMMNAKSISFADIPLYYVYEREGSASRVFTKETAFKFKYNIIYLSALRKTAIEKFQYYLIDSALYSTISASANYYIKSGSHDYSLLYKKLELDKILPIKVGKDYYNLKAKVWLLNKSFSLFCFLKKIMLQYV